jgi:polar amino acid transport system substrate-binding protein
MKNLLVLLLFFPFALLAEPTLVLHTENEPPFSMRKNELAIFGPNDPLTGISVKILNTLFSRVKIPYVMKIDQWEISYKNALMGSNHGVFSTTRTKERENLFKWVGPLVVNDWYLVGRENFDTQIKEVSDPNLKKFRIGTLKAGAIFTFLSSKGFSLIEFASGFECALALKEGRIDLWAVGGQTALYYAKKVGVENQKNVLLLQGHQFLYLALNPKIPDALVNTLNRELGIMRKDGTIRDIYRKFSGF